MSMETRRSGVQMHCHNVTNIDLYWQFDALLFINFSPFSLITDSICLHSFAGMATPMSGRSLPIFLTIFH